MQTYAPIKPGVAVELIRSMPGSVLRVVRDGHEHKRQVARAFGAIHLDKSSDELSDEERLELDAYGNLVDELVEDGRLIAHENTTSLGSGGIVQEDVVEIDVVYTPTANPAISFSHLESGIASPNDLLELIKEEGRLVYTSRFRPGALGYDCTLPQFCGEDPSRLEVLLGYIEELRTHGKIEVHDRPYLYDHVGSKGEVTHGIPATVHILRAV